MGDPNKMDFGGQTLQVKDIETGVLAPGGSGSSLSGTELGLLDGAVAANTGTSKAVITGTSGAVALGGELTLAAGTTLNLDSATATLVSHAATITKYACQVTTEALTTAAGASQAFVLTLTGVAATDLAFVSRAAGTSTGGTPLFRAACTTNTITVTVDNKHASAALDGTLIFNLWVLKA